MAGDNDTQPTGLAGPRDDDAGGGGSAVAAVDRSGSVAAPMSESGALLSMIERMARDTTIDPDRVERFFAMHQQAMARQARNHYLAAFAKLQADLPAVARKGTGHNSKKYARFEDVIEAIRAPLAQHGFSLSFRTKHEGQIVRITGILGHEAGHQEETDLPLPADTSGSKNAVQAWGSSISYGKRYVALTLLGIATEDDDDGKAAGAGATITDEQAEKIKKALDEIDGSLPRFCAYFRLEKLGDLPAAQFARAMASINKKRAAQ